MKGENATISDRGVGRSRIFGGGGESACARAPAPDDNQKISDINWNGLILRVQGAEPPEALAILSNER